MLKCSWKNSYLILFILFGACKSTSVSWSSNNCSINNIVKVSQQNVKDIEIKYRANALEQNKKIEGKIKFDKSSVLINGVYSAMGIEVFRLLLDNDSITFINRMNKNYYRGPVKDFPYYSQYNFILGSINALLSAKAIATDQLEMDSDCNAVSSIYGYAVTYKSFNNGFIESATFSKGAEKIRINYSNFDAKFKLPKTLLIENKEKDLVKFDIYSISKYSSTNSISIPKNYKQL